MKLTVEQVLAQGNHLFERKYPILTLWQNIAENFYPERADFTTTRNVGAELADTLVDSYPILARRDMANALSSMLRDGRWFEGGIDQEPDYEGKAWLKWATGRMYQFMGDRRSNFDKATKQGDHDYAAFGQTVLSFQPNKLRNGILAKNWHLRDCAWFEDEADQVAGMHRKWMPTRNDLVSAFKKENLHPSILSEYEKKPFEEVEVRHVCVPAELYGDDQISERFSYVSLYIDVKNKHLIEVSGMTYFMYVVPRFQTISGSQYAYSPCTVVALPDARLLQAMTHTILEAGERYTRPPLIATQKVIRSDVDLSADGITWVDDEYDERLGAALRPIAQNSGGFPIGLELRDQIKSTITSAFYLNKLSPPDMGREVTAYEFSERMKSFRRESLPIIAPTEKEYNGAIVETVFELMMRMGLLGSPYDIPDSIKGAKVTFKFKSPLSESEEEEKRNKFLLVREMVGSAMEIDPTVRHDVSFSNALRDAIDGIGAPTAWVVPPEVAEENKMVQAMQQAAQVASEQGGQ
jgi:hypothetical protein